MMKRTKLRVLTVGGGSGGHVTPSLAVINELAGRHSDIDVRFWCDRGYLKQSQSIMKHAFTEVRVAPIFAGKLRRYHGSSLGRQLLDFPTVFRNIFDFFLVALGFFQSIIKLLVWRPQVAFLKGGFVCLPVGYAAHFLRIPIVIHDSDAHPGLTNRLLARYAARIATGAPLEYYNYPKTKTQYVGIPVRSGFRPLDEAEKARVKTLFHLPSHKPLVVVTGGGLGAKRINDTVVAIAPELLRSSSIVHLCGKAQYDELRSKVPQSADYKLIAFLSDHLNKLLGAADVVVTRAGASAMAEMACTAACVIIVPNGQLVGGHQLKNAQVFIDSQAALLADETQFMKEPNLLLEAITGLLDNPIKRDELSRNLHAFAKPHAARHVADMIEEVIKK